MSMNDNDQFGSQDDQGDNQVTLSRQAIRALEKSATEGKSAVTELAQLKREMAFRDAGINPADPRQSYFVKGYDGEASADAIKAAAIEAGFLQGADAGAPQGAGGVPPGFNPATGQPLTAFDMAQLQRANLMTQAPQQPSVNLDATYFQGLAAASAQSPQAVVEYIQRMGVPTPGLGE